MSKRPYSTYLEDEVIESSEAISALYLVLQHSNEFASCIRGLEAVRDLIMPDGSLPVPPGSLGPIIRKFADVCTIVLPAISTLAHLRKNAVSSAAPAKKVAHEDRIAVQPIPETLPPLQPSYAVPLTMYMAPWTVGEIKSSKWPDLPAILDPALEKIVFMHPGIYGKSWNGYDRLEFLGDAYLEIISTCLIHQTFGLLSAGRCSQLRELLVRNSTLSGYFQKYEQMMQAARIPEYVQDKKSMAKIQADMFEAYVAAVIVSDPADGLARATSWLKILWGPTIEQEVKTFAAPLPKVKLEEDAVTKVPETAAVDQALTKAEAERPVLGDSKRTVATMLCVPNISSVRYENVDAGFHKDRVTGLALFTVNLYLDGWGEHNRLLATGKGLSKKEAGQKAAAAALRNEKLMRTFEERKHAFLRERDSVA